MKFSLIIFPLHKNIKILSVVILLSLTIVYTIPWTIQNSLEKEYSGVDFHGYWYAGHFIRQGVNSYDAILNNPDQIYWDPLIPGSGDPYQETSTEYSLNLPIHYLDGRVVREFPVAKTLIVVPAISAPLNLLLGLFSWFSWPTARLVWMILNFTFAIIIPWTAIPLLPNQRKLFFIDKLIFALVFYNFYGLRQSIVVGQQTLVCLLFLILALLFRKNWLLSGILLGFGISKYSVGLPVFVYLFMLRKYRVIIAGLSVQALAILLLATLRSGSLINTLMAYYKIFEVNYLQNGVHLPARFPGEQLINIMLVLLILIPSFIILVKTFFLQKPIPLSDNKVGINDLLLITIAIFLTTYHRIHDMPFMIFFLLLIISIMIKFEGISFSKNQLVIYLLSVAFVIVLLLFPTIPGKIMEVVGLSEDILSNWGSVEAASSVALLVMFILSISFQINNSPQLNSLKHDQFVL